MKALIIFRNILTVILIAGILALGITAIIRSQRTCREIDSYCKYLDEKYGWTWD